MNTFYNPLFLLKILKSYMFDINRLNRFDEEKLKKYGWKPPKKDFNILDEEIEYSESESDDEIQNELDRGLN